MTERGDGTDALEDTLLVLPLLPLELSVFDWTFFSVEVGDALTAGFLAKSAPVLSTKDVFFSTAGFEPAARADTSLVFLAPSDSVGLDFLAAAELPLSCCFPAVPVLLLLGAELAFSDEVDFIKEDQGTPRANKQSDDDEYINFNGAYFSRQDLNDKQKRHQECHRRLTPAQEHP